MFEGTLSKIGAALGGEIPGQVHFGVQGPPGPDGGHYIPNVNQTNDDTAVISFTPSKNNMPSVDPVQIKLPKNKESGGKRYTEILPETSKTETEDEFVVIDYLPVLAGKNYLIKWNGTEYECTARKLGDVAIVLGGDGHPFAIECFDDSTEVYPRDGSTTFTVGILEEEPFATEKWVEEKLAKHSGGNVDLTGYATEQYVKNYAQPKGEYLTEVPDGYAKTVDIPTKPEDIGAQPSGNYLTEVPSGYATEEFVKNKIAEAEIGGEEVDLSGYAQKSELPTKVSQLENDSGYLTEHQDISGKLDASELPTAINTALAQAKASGEFDGEKGNTGVRGEPGKDGVSVTHSWNGTTLTVTSASGTSSANLKGDKGDKGDSGADGYSPVRGTDYWTDADIAEIKSYVDDAILGGAW